MKSDDEIIAVYGTLKRGEPNHINWMGQAEYLGDGCTSQAYPMVVSSIPYLFNDPGIGHRVNVEVYAVSYSELLHIDRLEGHPDFYTRIKTQIDMNDKKVSAWVYMINSPCDVKNAKYVSNYSYHGSR
jgi:gamma-glutamylaminecyclotransferase